MRVLLLFGLATTVLSACSDDDRPDAIPPGTSGGPSVPEPGGGGSGGSSGGAGRAGAAGTGGTVTSEGGSGGEPSAVDAPRVAITSPEPVQEPGQGEILVEDEVEVVCQVLPADIPDPAAIDPSTVRLRMMGADGETLEDIAAAPTGEPDEYSGSFILSDVPNGPVSFQCTALDRGRPPTQGTHSVSTFVDHGPVVQIQSPLSNSVHPLSGEVPVEFTVIPEPVSTSDAGAEIGDVSLEVDGVPIEVEVLTQSPLTYATSINFADPVLFPSRPVGSVPVLLRASNQRAPKPATRVVSYNFTLDGEPPEITIQNPLPDRVIGGREVVLTFEVEDALSAIRANSVVVRLNNESFRYGSEGNWDRKGNTFTFIFDSTQISGSVWQLTVNVSAQDEAGNTARASRNFYLDNQPPIVDLDPAPIREQRRTSGDCSWLFDPLGSAANDLMPVTAAPLVRALVWDRTNHAGGTEIQHLATTNRSSVFLYLQPDLEADFVTDEDGDGRCDTIQSDGLIVQNLSAIEQTGSARFGTGEELPFDDVDLQVNCRVATSSNDPEPLCDRASDLIRVIDHAMSGEEPVIYGVGALEGLECTGAHWEILGLAGREGWVCLAAQATDQAGNRGVSAPLRLCLSDGVAPHPDCSAARAPDCSDGCTADVFPRQVVRAEP